MTLTPEQEAKCREATAVVAHVRMRLAQIASGDYRTCGHTAEEVALDALKALTPLELLIIQAAWSADEAQLWLPIESAPRDGERVLLYSPERITRKGKYKALRNPWISIGFWRTPTEQEMNSHKHALWIKHGGYWSSHFRGTQPLEGKPTHWMPLPTPPQQPTGTQEGIPNG